MTDDGTVLTDLSEDYVTAVMSGARHRIFGLVCGPGGVPRDDGDRGSTRRTGSWD